MKKLLILLVIFVTGAIGVVIGRSMRPSREIEAAQWSADQHPALDRIVARFDVEEHERGDVVDELAEQVNEPIIVNWNALQTFPPTEHITLHLKNVPVSVVLHEVFRTPDLRDCVIVYCRDNGSLMVTSNSDPQEVVRVYDVGDLIDAFPRKTSDERPEDAFIDGIEHIAQSREVAWPDYVSGPEFSLLGSQLIVTGPPDSQKRVFEVLEALRKVRAK